MAYPYNPNLSFTPSSTTHYVAFDSSMVNDHQNYRINFEQVYKNVTSLSIVSASLNKQSNY